MTPAVSRPKSPQKSRRAWPAAARAFIHRVARSGAGTTKVAGPQAALLAPPAQEPLSRVMRRQELVQGLSRTLIGAPIEHLPSALSCFAAAQKPVAAALRSPHHAIIVLGIAVFENDAPNPHFLARVQAAHALAIKFPEAMLVVTGAHVTHPYVASPEEGTLEAERIEAVAMQKQLVLLGLPKERILVEPLARHTVANLAYGFAKVEAQLLPAWGELEHLTISMEPYHAMRAARIAAALVATRTPATTLHVAMTQRLDAKLQALQPREKTLLQRQLCDAQGVANLNRCQREKRILASGW